MTLSELRGKTVVLYFYPKADTPGCTTQACGVRDHRADYGRRRDGARRVARPGQAIAKFADKYDLGFPLLVRRGPRGRRGLRRVGREVDVRPQVHGQRAHNVRDRPDGKIKDVLRKVKPAEHDGLVLGALAGS